MNILIIVGKEVIDASSSAIKLKLNGSMNHMGSLAPSFRRDMTEFWSKSDRQPPQRWRPKLRQILTEFWSLLRRKNIIGDPLGFTRLLVIV